MPLSTISGEHEGDDAWRPRLLQSLRDCGSPPRKRSAILRGIAYFVVAIIFAIVSLAMSAMLADRHARFTPAERSTLGILWFLFAVFVFARLRNWLLRGFWQARARTADQELQRAGSRRPVLYLRSFQLDSRIGRPSLIERFLGSIPLATDEQNVARALRKAGPMIAIGRPGESLPALGAARFYVSHAQWQEKVVEVVEVAQYVLWATGATEGLRWEISHLIASLDPEKLIVWAHPHLLRIGGPEREAEWRKFLEMMGPLFPKPLPAILGRARFFYFTKDWAPRAVAPPLSLRGILNPNGAAARAVLAVKQGRRDESRVVYRGATAREILESDFRSLIGAAGDGIHWPQAAAFFAARLAYVLPILAVPDRMGGLHFGAGRLVNIAIFGALIPTLGALLAFRWIRNVAAASAVCATAIFACNYLQIIFQTEPGYLRRAATSNLFPQWIGAFLFFLLVAAAVRRIQPLPLALWIGATVASVTGAWINQQFTPHWANSSAMSVLVPLLGPILFAFSFWLGLRLLPSVIAQDNEQ